MLTRKANSVYSRLPKDYPKKTAARALGWSLDSGLSGIRALLGAFSHARGDWAIQRDSAGEGLGDLAPAPALASEAHSSGRKTRLVEPVMGEGVTGHDQDAFLRGQGMSMETLLR